MLHRLDSLLDNEKKSHLFYFFLPNQLEYVTNTRSDYELTLSLEFFQKTSFSWAKCAIYLSLIILAPFSEDPILLY